MDIKEIAKNTQLLQQIAIIILIVGGINTGLYGLVKFNFITAILGELLARLFFIIIGAAAGYLIYLKATKKG